MRAEDRKKYLENRRRRTHFAIKCKRILGEYVPSSGPLDEDPVPNMIHNLINYRAGDNCKPSKVQNLMAMIRKDHSKVMYFVNASASHRRRGMTARRIAHRLGYLKERADEIEKHKWSMAAFHKWKWVTNFNFQITPSIRLLAGTEVSFMGDGTFRYENDDFEIILTAEQARKAGVSRHKRGHPIR